MAEKYFPFNSVSGDRSYSAVDFAAYFADIISSGVSANGDNLGITSTGGLNLSAATGFAWIKGHLYENSAPKTLSLSPGTTLPRIDRVVVRLMVAERKIEMLVVQGTPASLPSAPALVRTDDYYDIGLAEINIAASAISITNADIGDTRTHPGVCGVVRTLIETLDVSAFMRNSQAEFNKWFANLQYVLDGDVAGHLQNQIDAIVQRQSITPGNVTDISVQPGNAQVSIHFADPADSVWAGTKVVMKAGSTPLDETDGTLILDNTVSGQYSTTPFVQTGLTNNTRYYFSFFPYNAQGAINYSINNVVSARPVGIRVMTAVIDLGNSNPATSVAYADDAVGMDPGSLDWDEFFGHYPVLFNNGVEVGKLNPNNFAQFADGSPADITSGTAGDVMIAFPRRGLKITTVGDMLTISMTDGPDNAAFEYMAHSRDTARKEKFYLGAYKGNVISSRLRSLSGKTPTVEQPIATSRTRAQANGTGYEQSGFYQLTFRQAMYILKYRNLNSQTVVGRGYTSGQAAQATGATNANGMDYGSASATARMKLFGIEDFWGNVHEWIDGLVTDSARNILTATTGFNNNGSGYTNNGPFASTNMSGYMSRPQGTTNAGFTVKATSGSDNTYFCDSVYFAGGTVTHAWFGGYWGETYGSGAFRLVVMGNSSIGYVDTAARLMYL